MAPTHVTVNIVFGLKTIFVFPISSQFVTLSTLPSLINNVLNVMKLKSKQNMGDTIK